VQLVFYPREPVPLTPHLVQLVSWLLQSVRLARYVLGAPALVP
jgi:hypothetical protein